ncbi:hypothetical protein WR25_05589 [Diploscapter pachys]|uniref:t-SNARE coiled-coil homology domain-containing protein n=1 Tax=Diploscapter pachys TaxID=2018661 RepID=A0A2A2LT64_9BILA|nr:hypothetical protein WR25_05589 [Diploscapter pachys]
MVRDRLAEFQNRSGLISTGGAQHRTANEETVQKEQMDSAAAALLNSSNGAEAKKKKKKKPANPRSSSIQEEAEFELVALPFLSKINELRQETEELERITSKVKEIHAIMLSRPDAENEHGKELSELNKTFTEISMVVKKRLIELDKDIAHEKDELKANGGKMSTTQRTKHMQLSSLNRKFLNVITAFNDEQERFKAKTVKEVAKYLRHIHGLDVTDDVIERAVEDGDTSKLMPGLVLATADAKALFEDVRNRHDQLLEIEKSIRLLHELFFDMHRMVAEQGEMVDRIDMSIVNAMEYAERGRKNVIEARNLKKKAARWRCCLIILCVIVVIILLIIIQGMVCHFTPIC